VPLYAQLARGEDSLTLDVSGYPPGTYYVRCTLEQSGTPLFIKMFKHAKKGQTVTYTKEETALHNTMPMCDGATCTAGNLSDIRDFLRKFPCYLDRGQVYSIAFKASVRLSEDSTVIGRYIDSLLAYEPHFYAYYYIAQVLSTYAMLPSVARDYYFRAREALPSIPEARLSENSARLSEIQKKIFH
jgi:hypothetical protein